MIPPEVLALVDERERARADRDFTLADSLRAQIREAGFDVVDTPNGPEVNPAPPPAFPRYRRSQDVPARLGEAPSSSASVQWLIEGWPEDVRRGIESVHRTCPADVQQVVVEAAGGDDDLGPAVDVVRVEPEIGWAAARNAGIRVATGRIVIVVDGSVELSGDCVTPLLEALADPSVGVTGPFGIVSEDLHEFEPSEGPDVDAVEGYLMAFRRDLVEAGLRFDEKFRFYRTADIELSFQIKALGLRATVTPVPVIRHEHRVWANTDEHERQRLSKRNFYRFLDRWRGRTDLLVGRS